MDSSTASAAEVKGSKWVRRGEKEHKGGKKEKGTEIMVERRVRKEKLKKCMHDDVQRGKEMSVMQVRRTKTMLVMQ